MKIKTLVTHVIDRAIDKVVQHVHAEDDSLLIRLAAKINPATLGEHIDVDYEDLAQAMDAAKVARHVEVDTEDLAECLDTSDIADYIDLEGLAEYINVPARDVAEHIDYAELAKQLDPLESLAASQGGAAPAEAMSRMDLDSAASKLLDLAVDKLLDLANKSVESDLAEEERTKQEAVNESTHPDKTAESLLNGLGS